MSPTDTDDGPEKDRTNALARYSLLGHGEELERQVAAQAPLLGDVCLSGEFTVWCAEPGTGKTLLPIAFAIEAVEEKHIKPVDVFHVNMDDSVHGVVQKNRMVARFRES